MRFSQEITPFTTYELTEQEQLVGQVFSEEQLAVLQNEIAILAAKKVEMVIDPSFPAEPAEVDGQISILRFIIDRSNKTTLGSYSSYEEPNDLQEQDDGEGLPTNALDL